MVRGWGRRGGEGRGWRRRDGGEGTREEEEREGGAGFWDWFWVRGGSVLEEVRGTRVLGWIWTDGEEDTILLFLLNLGCEWERERERGKRDCDASLPFESLALPFFSPSSLKSFLSLYLFSFSHTLYSLSLPPPPQTQTQNPKAKKKKSASESITLSS